MTSRLRRQVAILQLHQDARCTRKATIRPLSRTAASDPRRLCHARIETPVDADRRAVD
ncbi:hypothetical protein PXO_05482 [Xanthomonas oryzae pv. oryzae PXO99A]|uniref:Uncharacterized protein n=1 Tax=Xanthomonas oryzae pv. oryzae (strain PXO99A) TaxID=360094 RepID=A0A0K0GHF7_XANOP|nr:hypothetical protein PXO_05482 [Xanthomonas oryzae pv. oryzae PXO99A]